MVVGGRFFAGSLASKALYEEAEPIVDAGELADLWPGLEKVAGGWASVKAWVQEPWVPS